MPINIMDAHFRSFQYQVIPVCNAKRIGVLAMKTFAFGAIIKANVADPIDMLHYSMTLPVSVVITGMDTMPRLDQALTAAKNFKPMTEEQIATLLAKSTSPPTATSNSSRPAPASTAPPTIPNTSSECRPATAS